MRLEKYLKDMCINRNEFCKKIGVSYPTIASLMHGERDIHLATAIRIEDITEGKVTCRDLVIPHALKALEARAKMLMSK